MAEHDDGKNAERGSAHRQMHECVSEKFHDDAPCVRQTVYAGDAQSASHERKTTPADGAEAAISMVESRALDAGTSIHVRSGLRPRHTAWDRTPRSMGGEAHVRHDPPRVHHAARRIALMDDPVKSQRSFAFCLSIACSWTVACTSSSDRCALQYLSIQSKIVASPTPRRASGASSPVVCFMADAPLK